MKKCRQYVVIVPTIKAAPFQVPPDVFTLPSCSLLPSFHTKPGGNHSKQDSAPIFLICSPHGLLCEISKPWQWEFVEIFFRNQNTFLLLFDALQIVRICESPAIPNRSNRVLLRQFHKFLLVVGQPL